MAKSLNLSETQVKTWYQNRRTKWKRQNNFRAIAIGAFADTKLASNSNGTSVPTGLADSESLINSLHPELFSNYLRRLSNGAVASFNENGLTSGLVDGICNGLTNGLSGSVTSDFFNSLANGLSCSFAPDLTGSFAQNLTNARAITKSLNLSDKPESEASRFADQPDLNKTALMNEEMHKQLASNEYINGLGKLDLTLKRASDTAFIHLNGSQSNGFALLQHLQQKQQGSSGSCGSNSSKMSTSSSQTATSESVYGSFADINSPEISTSGSTNCCPNSIAKLVFAQQAAAVQHKLHVLEGTVKLNQPNQFKMDLIANDSTDNFDCKRFVLNAHWTS